MLFANAVVRKRLLRQVVHDLRKVPLLVSRVREPDLIVGKDSGVVIVPWRGITGVAGKGLVAMSRSDDFPRASVALLPKGTTQAARYHGSYETSDSRSFEYYTWKDNPSDVDLRLELHRRLTKTLAVIEVLFRERSHANRALGR